MNNNCFVILCTAFPYWFSASCFTPALLQCAQAQSISTFPERITVERVAYKGWPNCYRLANNLVDLIVTTDVGPRVIRFGFLNEDNEFKEYEEMMGKTGGEEWRIYGGHRLWHAPESVPRTYCPDNSPVKLEQDDGIVRLIQATETTTGIQKEIDLSLSSKSTHVKVTHRLRNTNLWAVELAPWALSVMAPGGEVIIPFPPRGTHPENLLPTNTLTMWAYTDMTDPRWTWGKKYLILRQDKNAKDPQKIGVMDTEGWAAYTRAGHLFVKKFQFLANRNYPDLGCTLETFTNKDMIELETVAPLVKLEPGASVEHVEHWFLFRDVPVPKNDAEVDKDVLPKVLQADTTE